MGPNVLNFMQIFFGKLARSYVAAKLTPAPHLGAGASSYGAS